MAKLKLSRCGYFLASILAGIAGVLLLFRASPPYLKLERFDLGGGSSLVIFGKHDLSSPSRSVYTEVRLPGSSSGIAHVGSTFEAYANLDFHLVKSVNGDVVAIVESSSPSIVICMVDLRSGGVWPHGTPTMDLQEKTKLGDDLLELLNQSLDRYHKLLIDATGSDHSESKIH